MRETKGVSQAKLAEAVSYSAPRLSQIENDESPCPPDVLISIKKALKLEGVPFYDLERQGFKDKLYRWHDTINDTDFDKAKKMQEELSPITYLPFDKELNAFYSMFKCKLLLAVNDMPAAKEILQSFDIVSEEPDYEILYHYYYNMGSLSYKTTQRKDALNYYLKAKEVMAYGFEGSARLHFNIATCLISLGFVVSSILFLENVRELYSGGQAAVPSLRIDSMIAIGFIGLGQLPKAKKLLEKCLRTVESTKDEALFGIILHNLGYLYRKAGDWNMSMEYLNQATGHFTKGSSNYLENLYQKVRCLADMKAFSTCTELLDEGKKLSADNKPYAILFESVRCLIFPNDSKSVEYLETVTIPYFLDIGENLTVLDYCEFLREHYERKGIVKKSGQMSEIARKIYKEMHSGGVIT
ncbi:MAG: helix-turn-helix transcriptional regulator [Firmicutes bacterium]|nr:helix-turn-helix transcriptional regulator [Bacillota bacterium]